jgi:hypothetical protein
MSALEVHPVADLFPMLAEDELAELAADIKQRGLLQPVVLDPEGRVLDGRNRLAACEMAGVEPEFTTYEGDDPAGYALAVNIARRHLTKGQKAMIIARTEYKNYTEAEISKQYVSWARQVQRHAPDLADSVVSGARSLDAAYETARQRKKDADSDDRKMALLRAQAPDLADQVTEERLTLSEAIAAMQERERKQAERRRDALALLTRIVDLTIPSSMSNGYVDSWAEHLADVDGDLIGRTQQAARVLADLAERIKQ